MAKLSQVRTDQRPSRAQRPIVLRAAASFAAAFIILWEASAAILVILAAICARYACKSPIYGLTSNQPVKCWPASGRSPTDSGQTPSRSRPRSRALPRVYPRRRREFRRHSGQTGTLPNSAHLRVVAPRP